MIKIVKLGCFFTIFAAIAQPEFIGATKRTFLGETKIRSETYANDDQYGLINTIEPKDVDDRVICQNIGALVAQKIFKFLKKPYCYLSEPAKISRLEKILNKIFIDLDDAVDENGKTVLHVAAQNSKWSGNYAKLLIKRGATVNKKNNDGDTPLHVASGQGETFWHDGPSSIGIIEVVKILLDNGADIDEKNNKGETALHRATLNDYANIIKLLIEHGADINAKDTIGSTPLHYVYEKEAAKVLIENGAHIYEMDKNNQTIVDYAKRHYRAPDFAGYILLADDFYQVKNRSMLFDDFIKKYFAGKQTNKNITNVMGLVSLGTKQFAQEFYQWRKQNEKINGAIKTYQQMLFTTLKETPMVTLKVALLPLLFPLPTENSKNQLNNVNLTIDKHTGKPTGKFKRKFAEFMVQEGLKQVIKPVKKHRKIAPIKKVKTKIPLKNKNFYDCKIFFDFNNK